MHYLILTIGDSWVVLWSIPVLLLGDLGQLQSLGSGSDTLETMGEKILWSHSLVPMVLLPLCPHHFLNILILWNPFDHSWTWESGRQNHMWGTFSSAFHIPSIHTIQSTVSRTCASGVLIYNYTLWYPFPSSESFFTSSSSLIPS